MVDIIDHIEEARSRKAMTRRPTSQSLEDILFYRLPVLDHGFLRVIDYMGDDSAVVQAARTSYGLGTKSVSDDTALIRYLMRHRHTTPFEMAEIKWHAKLPIFVARQWIRHRTANVNEYSARYSLMDNEFYIPTGEDLAQQSASNKQGRGDALSQQQAREVLDILKEDASRCYANYEWMVNDPSWDWHDPDRPGLARELARINLPISAYTQWYWKCDLRNLFHFLGLRADPHAQKEIRVYAEEMLRVLRMWVPVSTQAFEDYHLNAFTLSAGMISVVQRVVAGETVNQENSGLSRREWDEVSATLKLPGS